MCEMLAVSCHKFASKHIRVDEDGLYSFDGSFGGRTDGGVDVCAISGIVDEHVLSLCFESASIDDHFKLYVPLDESFLF